VSERARQDRLLSGEFYMTIKFGPLIGTQSSGQFLHDKPALEKTPALTSLLRHSLTISFN